MRELLAGDIAGGQEDQSQTTRQAELFGVILSPSSCGRYPEISLGWCSTLQLTAAEAFLEFNTVPKR